MNNRGLSLGISTYLALSSLAAFSCGKKSDEPLPEVTLEGIVYLGSVSGLTSTRQERIGRYGKQTSALSEVPVLGQGTVEAYCAAAGPYKECPQEGQYIKSVTVNSTGNYSMEVSSSMINDPGITLVAKDQQGNPVGATTVHDELYPTPTPPRTDISHETTGTTKTWYGALETAKKEFGKVTSDLYKKTLSTWNELSDLIKDCFRQSTTLNPVSVFDKILESGEQKSMLGNIYKDATGSSKDNAVAGEEVANSAKVFDYGNGNFIKIESAEDTMGKVCSSSVVSNLLDTCFYDNCYNESGGTVSYESCKSCCEGLGCRFAACSRDEVSAEESSMKAKECASKNGWAATGEDSGCVLGGLEGTKDPRFYIRCCGLPR